MFELRYPDGHTEFELPKVSGRATGLRLATLLDIIAETEYEPLRAMMVKMLAYAVWQEHSEAVKAQAVFGYVDFRRHPSFGRGKSNRIIRSLPMTLILPLRRLRDIEMPSLTNRLRNFLLTPQSSIWLTILRVGLGLQVLCYGLSLRGDWLELLGRENQGLIRRDLTEAMLSARSPFIPRVGWIVDIGVHLGLERSHRSLDGLDGPDVCGVACCRWSVFSNQCHSRLASLSEHGQECRAVKLRG